MAFRFWRRMKILPGVTMNLSKSGASLSFGPRGAKYTIGSRGSRGTVGIPGSGLFYTKQLSKGKGSGNSRRRGPKPAPEPPESKLEMGFFDRLTAPDEEKAFVEGCKAIVADDQEAAYRHLSAAADEAPDAAFLAGFLSLNLEEPRAAIDYFFKAASNAGNLGSLFDRYGVTSEIKLAITEEVTAHATASRRGALLGLVEAYQKLGEWEYARACLSELLETDPNDIVAKVSLAEILVETPNPVNEEYEQVIELAADVDNDSEVEAALLLYRGKALRLLGMETAARDALTAALRKRKDRSDELLRAARYERALVYQALGQKKRARSELERVYAEQPDFEDVAERLGL